MAFPNSTEDRPHIVQPEAVLTEWQSTGVRKASRGIAKTWLVELTNQKATNCPWSVNEALVIIGLVLWWSQYRGVACKGDPGSSLGTVITFLSQDHKAAHVSYQHTYTLFYLLLLTVNLALHLRHNPLVM
jgi:hypothetical protein